VPGRGSPGSQHKPLRAATRREALPVRHTYPMSNPPVYAPESDGLPDPGEIVWAWVPFEDDPSQGKDRPVLLLGLQSEAADSAGVPALWVALQLSSQDHDRDAEDEASYGRFWMDVGSGDWDPQRRPSEVRLDRAIMVTDDAIRREGAALDRVTFDAVVAAASAFHRLNH
jgi:PemK-like, MazF-like toxin of type II toxin-antitoxin system